MKSNQLTIITNDMMNDIIQKAGVCEYQQQYVEINEIINLDDPWNPKNFAKREDYNKFVELNKILDKYYTKTSVALECYNAMKDILAHSNISIQDALFIEPSAGAGVFLNVIEEDAIGFDIAPTRNKRHTIRKNNFLEGDLLSLLSDEEKNKRRIFLGNPPFGRHSSLAFDFFKKAFEYSDIVGFIIPLQFRKWQLHQKMNKLGRGAKLVLDMDLPREAFELMGKDYAVGCCFQIWALPSAGIDIDLKMQSKPANTHKDFEIIRYCPKKPSLKYKEFMKYAKHDFIVQCNGFNKDFSQKIYNIDDCKNDQTYIIFRAKTREALNRLYQINFSELIKKDRVRQWGFGLADFVKEYIRVFGDIDTTSEVIDETFDAPQIVKAEVIIPNVEVAEIVEEVPTFSENQNDFTFIYVNNKHFVRDFVVDMRGSNKNLALHLAMATVKYQTIDYKDYANNYISINSEYFARRSKFCGYDESECLDFTNLMIGDDFKVFKKQMDRDMHNYGVTRRTYAERYVRRITGYERDRRVLIGSNDPPLVHS